MLDWNDLQVFAEVARRGSMSSAARAMAIHQTTVARRVSAAEEALGAPLFLRSTRGITLAPAGLRLLASLRPLTEVLDDVVRKAVDHSAAPVRVAVTDNGARILAAALFAHLRSAKPRIEVELVSGNAVIDLARGDADLAIRVIAPTEANLVRQRLGAVRYNLYASRGYLDGAPAWRDGGPGHDVLMPGAELAHGPEARWLGEHARDARVILRASNLVTLAAAAEHGAGLCVMPTDLAAFHRELVRVRRLPEIPERPVWLVMHRDARKEPRIRRVAELAAAAIRGALQRSG